MHRGIRLISKPPPPSLCRLLVAVCNDELERLAKESHYVIEDEAGERVSLYARNDADCHQKIVKKWMAGYDHSRNSNFF